MNVEICRDCGDSFDPIEMVNGTCWMCMQEEDPLNRFNSTDFFDEVEKDVPTK